MANNVSSNELRAYCFVEQNPQILAAHIVAYRFLGINKELATECMIELARRRSRGLEFDYEKYIKEKLDEISQKVDKIKIDMKKATVVLNNSELRNGR